ncbi:MAG: YihA family ribosome biogenesis GTP-binding protein [Muribaculaceae bacterium]|nr:YihA family ribosome biogenesis GTP-binding protein [Muribaculaceae bacterium]
MIIKTAYFEISNTDVRRCPQSTLPEYAFIGRSNVGKSSLINTLVNQKALAKTSSKPGKTLLINHFIINNEWYIVDLPGYGYAQRSKTQRDELRRIIENYILMRQQLTNLFLLVDIRLKPQPIDLEFMQWLGENEVPFSIVFTKADKLGTLAAAKAIEEYKNILLETWEELPPIFVTSSLRKSGRDEILDYIEEINKSLTAK